MHTCFLYLQKTEGGIGSLRTGVTGGCDLTWGCGELNLGLLEEQRVLWSTEPSHQPDNLVFIAYFVRLGVGALSEIRHKHILAYSLPIRWTLIQNPFSTLPPLCIGKLTLPSALRWGSTQDTNPCFLTPCQQFNRSPGDNIPLYKEESDVSLGLEHSFLYSLLTAFSGLGFKHEFALLYEAYPNSLLSLFLQTSCLISRTKQRKPTG